MLQGITLEATMAGLPCLSYGTKVQRAAADSRIRRTPTRAAGKPYTRRAEGAAPAVTAQLSVTGFHVESGL